MTLEIDKINILQQLQSAWKDLMKSIRLRDEVAIDQTADAMDQIQAAEARELAMRNLDRFARSIREIDEALRRVDLGVYGTCTDCEEEISPKRLLAVPWTHLCLRCQELADQEEREATFEQGDGPWQHAA